MTLFFLSKDTTNSLIVTLVDGRNLIILQCSKQDITSHAEFDSEGTDDEDDTDEDWYKDF